MARRTSHKGESRMMLFFSMKLESTRKKTPDTADNLPGGIENVPPNRALGPLRAKTYSGTTLKKDLGKKCSRLATGNAGNCQWRTTRTASVRWSSGTPLTYKLCGKGSRFETSNSIPPMDMLNKRPTTRPLFNPPPPRQHPPHLPPHSSSCAFGTCPSLLVSAFPPDPVGV